MIRKSAFQSWGPSKDATHYVFENLADSGKTSGPDDPMAAALAVLSVREKGLYGFLGASLAFAPPDERAAYRAMLMSGFSELEALLARDGLL